MSPVNYPSSMLADLLKQVGVTSIVDSATECKVDLSTTNKSRKLEVCHLTKLLMGLPVSLRLKIRATDSALYLSAYRIEVEDRLAYNLRAFDEKFPPIDD